MSERYNVTQTESGLLVAGPHVGFRTGTTFEMPAEGDDTEGKAAPTTAVASTSVKRSAPRSRIRGGA